MGRKKLLHLKFNKNIEGVCGGYNKKVDIAVSLDCPSDTTQNGSKTALMKN